VRELFAPDGSRHWTEECLNIGLDTDCQIQLANGGRLAYRTFWPVIWSADSLYLLIAVGGSHDTPPGGYQIWDMATETRVAEVTPASAGWLWWSPEGHSLAYVAKEASGQLALALLDPATGQRAATRQCPDWAMNRVPSSDALQWNGLCDNWTPPAGVPVVISFSVTPAEVLPGQPVTLTWESVGGTTAEVRQSSPSGALHDPVPVPPSGAVTLTVDASERLLYTFDLLVSDLAGNTDRRSRTVQLLCPDAFFFTDAPPPQSAGCPFAPAAAVPAAEQAFEHGQMLWLGPIPSESTADGVSQGASVYVFYDAGVLDVWPVWQRYDDTWSAADSTVDQSLAPPEGLFQPERSFGKVWRQNPDVQTNLGWALAPEQGFAGGYQLKWDYYSKPGDLYLRTADGTILWLAGTGYWGVWQP
jgi:hypothetical protein